MLIKKKLKKTQFSNIIDYHPCNQNTKKIFMHF